MNKCYAKDYCRQFNGPRCNNYCDFHVILNTLYNLSNIPNRYRYDIPLSPQKSDIESFKKLANFKYDILENVDCGKWLYIYSSNSGNGKSTWATKIVAHYFRNILSTGEIENQVVYLNTNLFLEKLRANYDNPDAEFSALLDRAYKCKLLILDDIGVEKGTQWTQERLYDLINSRYNDMKSTIFTSNLSPTELEQKLGTRIASRVKSAIIIQLVGQDRRG